MRKHFVAAVAALAGCVLIWMTAPAMAGPIVDPSTLEPTPPPGAVCRADGPWTICQTTFLEEVVNEPVFDLPCGAGISTGSS